MGQLKQAIEKIQAGDFGARVERSSSDEFGTLADGFNSMAEHLQSMYKNLEAKVTEKTAQLQDKTERLSSLYEMSALVANAPTLDVLAQQFTQSLARIAHADGVALRWSDQYNQRHVMLAASGLPADMHFRTRTNAEDIEPALITTLQKFEHQSGIQTHLNMEGHGLPLSPDLQVQVLHIVQEALSNVRKHAHASQVWLEVQQQPHWRFEVRDDGSGFAHSADTLDQTHVGLRIMTERAERIGAALQVTSSPGQGCSVVLSLTASSAAGTPGAAASTNVLSVNPVI